ncbi:MAG: DNA-binding protein WhiA [Bacilli bacterium]|nr:DNA-binding protein WhiA [Bacilli bacterium]
MSFTREIKDEVSKIETSNTEEISELSGIISTIPIKNNITIKTENNSVARRIYTLFKNIYNIHPKITVRRGYNYNKKLIYIISVNDRTEYILKDLGISKDKIENFITSDDELTRAFLRGVFLLSGSINDPKTSRYHLEFNLTNKMVSNFISKLLNQYNLNSKVLHRNNNYMVYIKEAEKISDFLRMIGSYNGVLYFEDIRIYRDHKNMTNRLNNCEQANIEKTIETATNQVKDIELIKEKCGLEILSQKEQTAAQYRLKYNEASLTELAEIITLETNEKITKSGLYHRFKKIKNLANKLKNKN